jgi:hypothetical protein
MFAGDQCIGENDLRQVCERHILGTIDYTLKNETPGLAVGITLPAIRISQPNGVYGHLNTIAGQHTVLIFVPGNCATCADKFLDALSKVLHRTSYKMKLLILFSPRFAKAAISQQLIKFGLDRNSWFAEEIVPGWEDFYKCDEGVTPSVITLQQDHTIKSIQELTQWLLEMS